MPPRGSLAVGCVKGETGGGGKTILSDKLVPIRSDVSSNSFMDGIDDNHFTGTPMVAEL